MKRICEAFGVLFIADEVMTGWGRTGTLFACEQASVSPGHLCLAKGLTGGAIPLAATLCRPGIFEAHFVPRPHPHVLHSSSYTANPLACAAAVANLDVWAKEPVRERVAALTAAQSGRIASLADDGRFENVRRLGTIVAVDFEVARRLSRSLGPKLYHFFLSRGLLLRPLGNTVYVMPPYCATLAELDAVYAAIVEAAELI